MMHVQQRVRIAVDRPDDVEPEDEAVAGEFDGRVDGRRRVGHVGRVPHVELYQVDTEPVAQLVRRLDGHVSHVSRHRE